MPLFPGKNVLDSCSFRDEDDDCTYHYTAENTKDKADGILELQVLKKKGEEQCEQHYLLLINLTPKPALQNCRA